MTNLPERKGPFTDLFRNGEAAMNDGLRERLQAIDSARRLYFEAVFIGDSFWGPISPERAESEKCRIFPCDSCSLSEHKVYHNLIGMHCHISAADLIERIETTVIEH